MNDVGAATGPWPNGPTVCVSLLITPFCPTPVSSAPPPDSNNSTNWIVPSALLNTSFTSQVWMLASTGPTWQKVHKPTAMPSL